MKFRPRFSIRTLAILVTLVAFSVWWITWPQRTAQRFFWLLSEAKFEEASKLMTTEKDREFIREVGEEMGNAIKSRDRRKVPDVEFVDRSWSDIFLGRGVLKMGMAPVYVQRGRISLWSWDQTVD